MTATARAGRPRVAVLLEERHRVDTEATEPELHPESDDLGDLVAHLRIGEVEVGLVAVEVVQVVLLGLLVDCQTPSSSSGKTVTGASGGISSRHT